MRTETNSGALVGPAVVEAPAATADPRQWLALAVIALAQLMVVLDASIVNMALPHAQADLRISDADRQWVICAGLRRVAAARRPHRRCRRTQADLPDRPGRVRGRLRHRRVRCAPSDAVRRTRPCR
jgi:hypothetical protein